MQPVFLNADFHKGLEKEGVLRRDGPNRPTHDDKKAKRFDEHQN